MFIIVNPQGITLGYTRSNTAEEAVSRLRNQEHVTWADAERDGFEVIEF